MPQFLIPPGKRVGQTVALSSADSKHLIRVLRARPRDKVRLFDGTSRFEGMLTAVSPKEATTKITSLLIIPEIRGAVTLCQSLLKKDKMEWVIQKVVELGAARFVPFLSERSIAKEAGAVKLSRWQKIADEALKQCGRVTPLIVEPVIPYEELLTRLSGEIRKILFSVEEDLPLLTPEEVGGGLTVACLIGPEGGFSEKEIQMAKQKGYLVRSMGPLTLRSETAAITALALIQHELGNI